MTGMVFSLGFSDSFCQFGRDPRRIIDAGVSCCIKALAGRVDRHLARLGSLRMAVSQRIRQLSAETVL